jgi:hypothetical protein
MCDSRDLKYIPAFLPNSNSEESAWALVLIDKK